MMPNDTDINKYITRPIIEWREFCDEQEEKPFFCEVPEEFINLSGSSLELVTISGTSSGTSPTTTTTT